MEHKSTRPSAPRLSAGDLLLGTLALAPPKPRSAPLLDTTVLIAMQIIIAEQIITLYYKVTTVTARVTGYG